MIKIRSLFFLLLLMISTGGYTVEKHLEKATFAGGCFWCIEHDFEQLDGVFEVISGYTGGKKTNPTYEEVSSGTTGHVESIQVVFDPEEIEYPALLDFFWRHIDPVDSEGQFSDRGKQYTTAIFYHNEKQKKQALASKKALEEKLGKVVTEILPFKVFYPAEAYHQDYSKKNPLKYRFYRRGSGRDKRLRELWKESEAQLKKRLTPLQYEVTQQGGTEPAFDNAYWNHQAEGLYVDVVSGEPLFLSIHKFDSKTGWPSFTQPIFPEAVQTEPDNKFFMKRTEVRSQKADSHLGHVFEDGPKPTGLRYCINSAALRFIPVEEMRKEGYGKYLLYFRKNQ